MNLSRKPSRNRAFIAKRTRLTNLYNISIEGLQKIQANNKVTVPPMGMELIITSLKVLYSAR